MSRRHWHDEKMKYYDTKVACTFRRVLEKTFVQNNSLIEHLMWKASWNQYKNIVNRIKQ